MIGRISAVPGRDSRVDYLMLRKVKINQEDEETDSFVTDDTDDAMMSQALSRAITQNASSLGRQGSLKKQRSQRMTMSLRTSVKVNLRCSESALALNHLAKLAKVRTQGKIEERKGLDMEESKKQTQLISSMRQSRITDQSIFLKGIRASFDPLLMI